jgi:PAS domain S-box-containing protein
VTDHKCQNPVNTDELNRLKREPRSFEKHKQAEQLHFEQQRRYRGIYEYSNDAIFLVRVEADGRYVYEGNNPSHQQSTGFSRDYLCGKTPFDIVPAETAAQLIANYDNCIRKGAPVIYEEELDLPAGRRNWLTQLLPIPDSNGRIDLIAGISRDITGLKSATEALQKSEESFRVLIEKAPEAIIVFDTELNRIVMANANAERLFGCSRDELYNSGLLRFYLPEQPDGLPLDISFHKHNEQVMMGEDVVFERAIKNNHGDEFFCEVRLVRIPSANRKMIRASFIDITERKQAQAELSLALEIARRANEEQRQFLGLVSHELRTPLAVIDGAAQLILLKADRHSDSFKEAERIHAATVRLADLIDTCLTDERLSTAGWCPEMHPEDVRLLALKVAERIQACSTNHRIEHDLSGLPQQYTCDAMLLKVLLGNLLDNAVKYSPKGGIITMRGWSGEEGTVYFEVSDQGIGIAPDQIDRIFGRFYRVGQDTGIAGAGLGLHLVKQIAELHNGGVSCRSISGSGSVFTTWLGP